MPKPSLSDRLSAPSPGIPLWRLILIIIAVLGGFFLVGLALGKLFPTALVPSTQPGTQPVMTRPAR